MSDTLGFCQTKQNPYILLLMKEHDGYLPGYYFTNDVDEIEDGPFGSFEEAERCFNIYIKT